MNEIYIEGVYCCKLKLVDRFFILGGEFYNVIDFGICCYMKFFGSISLVCSMK